MAAHLTLAERQFLHRMVKAKKSKVEIGALMNRHRSTIYRELARNSNPWGYRAEAAHRWARKRRCDTRAPGSAGGSGCDRRAGTRSSNNWRFSPSTSRITSGSWRTSARRSVIRPSPVESTMRIQLLIGVDENGQPQTEPFEHQASAEEKRPTTRRRRATGSEELPL